MYSQPTAPLSIGGVLDDGFRLLQACFTRIFGLALLSSIISVVPNLLAPVADPDAAPTMAAELGWVFLLCSLLSVVLYGALVGSVHAVAKSAPISLADALGVGFRRFLPLIGCVLLMGLAILGGTLLFVVPGVILMVSLSVAPYLVITESMGAMAAVKASHKLVWGNWWRTATILAVIIFITMTAYILAGMLSGIGAFMSGPDAGAGTLAYAAIAALIGAVVTPLYYALGLALLHDLQLRKQGADLDQRIGAIEGA